jgi:hypothetical protein
MPGMSTATGEAWYSKDTTMFGLTLESNIYYCSKETPGICRKAVWYGHPHAADPADLDVAVWRHHGRLTGSEAARVRRAALAEVIAPCARALLAPIGSAAQDKEGHCARALCDFERSTEEGHPNNTRAALRMLSGRASFDIVHVGGDVARAPNENGFRRAHDLLLQSSGAGIASSRPSGLPHRGRRAVAVRQGLRGLSSL